MRLCQLLHVAPALPPLPPPYPPPTHQALVLEPNNKWVKDNLRTMTKQQSQSDSPVRSEAEWKSRYVGSRSRRAVQCVEEIVKRES